MTEASRTTGNLPIVLLLVIAGIDRRGVKRHG